MNQRILGAALALAFGATGAAAQNRQAIQLTPRGAVAGSDVVPCQPVGPNLEGCTAQGLAAYTLTSVDAFGADPTGVADSTTAIQAAINSGRPLTCKGVYKTSASILVETPASDGQILTGGGSWGAPDAFNATAPAGACIIRPTSAVARGIVIDGTPFPGGGAQQSWVQGFGMANLVIDMTNMADASTTSAINQIQAWDGAYTNVRVINDGTNKRAWLFDAGAFTTTLRNVQGHIIDMEGASDSFGVTTITLINPDIQQVIGNYTVNFKVEGGSVQCTACTAFYFRNASDIYLHTDIESLGGTTGAAYNFDTSDNGIWLQDELQGWSGSYMAGAPASATYFNFDNTISLQTCLHSITGGFLNLDNCGTGANNNRSSFLSGASNQDEYLFLGRTVGESLYGVAGNANDLISGTAPGDTVIGSNASGESTWIAAGGNAAAQFTSSAMTLAPGVAITARASPQSFLSNSLSVDDILYVGRTGNEGLVGVASAANHIVNGTVAGDVVVGSYASGGHTFLACGENPCWEGDAYGHQISQGYPAPTAGTGTVSIGGTAGGNDNAFTVTAESSVTESDVTFATTSYPWSTPPLCVVSGNSSSAFAYIKSVSTTALAIGWSAPVSGSVATVHCER
jgi:hypothetical protein